LDKGIENNRYSEIEYLKATILGWKKYLGIGNECMQKLYHVYLWKQYIYYITTTNLIHLKTLNLIKHLFPHQKNKMHQEFFYKKYFFALSDFYLRFII